MHAPQPLHFFACAVLAKASRDKGADLADYTVRLVVELSKSVSWNDLAIDI